MKLTTLNPNVAIIGAVAGFGLYLAYKWTGGSATGTVESRLLDGTASIGDKAAGAAVGVIEKNTQQAQEIGKQLPFSPFWWWDKIQNNYNEIR